MSTPLVFEPSPHPAPVETKRSADLFCERQTVRIFVEPRAGHRQIRSGLVHVKKAVIINAPSRMSTIVHGRRDFFPHDLPDLVKQYLEWVPARIAHYFLVVSAVMLDCCALARRPQ